MGINREDILDEAEKLLVEVTEDKEYCYWSQVDLILSEILRNINTIDFRRYCNLSEEKSSLKRKHFLVASVELLLESAKIKGFNLCRKNDNIYLFNSEHWVNLSEGVFKDFLSNVALKMGVDKYDAKHHLYKDEMYKQFLSDARLKEIKPNIKTTLINLKNGTFEIGPEKSFLREFRESDFLTYQLPFRYDPQAVAPQFRKFLDEVLPEQELQDILAEYIGYVFVKNSVLKLEKVLLLFGTGANGKSVLFEILMALLGAQNITNYSLQSLTAENGNSRAMLENKLLNYASEINGKLESSIFKQLISGEPVEAKLLYKDTQTITDYARFIFNCNELPTEIENTNGYFRRFLILPFKVTIPEDKQDKELSKRIIESELSGVFNWVLMGLERLLKNKSFTNSTIVQDEIQKYKKESDSVLMFLEEEGYEKSITFHRPLKDIYTEYKSYCLDGGYKPCSNKTFSKRLKNDGYCIERKSGGNEVFIQRKELDPDGLGF
ncbi:phage/plasmid primase, P4 family [Aestuariibaculum sp. M13]|uniref:DNA primase family protein n=1 Tax=Aestuariibaculum sp. M13 TaxID=2967132 RepID=UPI002159E063|nr:phage/plasmid primase, P4 family [Aestuariibaculum sp. M13]MCR8667894.1 phage/plasmid primase, P4 family [Aestuariibaculum sp. M13]